MKNLALIPAVALPLEDRRPRTTPAATLKHPFQTLRMAYDKCLHNR